MQQTKTSGGRAGYVVIYFFNLFPPRHAPNGRPTPHWEMLTADDGDKGKIGRWVTQRATAIWKLNQMSVFYPYLLKQTDWQSLQVVLYNVVIIQSELFTCSPWSKPAVTRNVTSPFLASKKSRTLLYIWDLSLVPHTLESQVQDTQTTPPIPSRNTTRRKRMKSNNPCVSEILKDQLYLGK